MAGWIALWRKFERHPDWTVPRVFSAAEAWIYLLMKANWEPLPDRHGDTIDRGAIATSTAKLMHDWQWSKGKVLRQLERWATGQQIDLQTSRKRTLIRINKYDEYQAIGSEGDPQAIQSRTPKRSKNRSHDNNITTNNTLSNERVYTASPDDQKIPCGELKNVFLTAKEKRAVVQWYQKKGLTVDDARRAVELLGIQLTKTEYARKIKSHAACLRGWVYSALLEEKARENRIFRTEPVRKHPPVVRADGGTIPAAISEIVNTATKRIA